MVSVAAGEIRGDSLDIILWLMSCRVLKRDMEYAMMDQLVRRCRELGIRTLVGYYFPTAKNDMVREFYAGQGFTRISQEQDGSTVWRLDLENYEKKNHVITIESTEKE